MLSGSLAAIAVLPTALPLWYRFASAETTVAEKYVTHAATLTEFMVAKAGNPQPGLASELGVDYLRVRVGSLTVYEEGDNSGAVGAACAAPQAVWTNDDTGRRWVARCSVTGPREVLAAMNPGPGTARQVPYLVLTLAAIVGIVTSLGVLRLLSPLSRMSRAIVRVGAGERGVRLPATGFAELDELVFRVNEAASAVEDREDAIMARIKAVQEMARMVAHEVRNPLQSLELLTSLIASEHVEAERHELAKAIHAEIRALDLVVSRVLREGASQAMPRLALHRSTQNVAPIVDQVLALRRPEAKAHGVSLELGPIADVAAEIDGAMLGRSLENLVLNALQAVRSKGARVRVSVEAEGEWFTVFVDDNGPGVDPALAEHVFEANVTGRTGGTGLGLALVREVVQAHGGTIVHERSPLGGARFTARLPVKAPRVQSPERPDRR